MALLAGGFLAFMAFLGNVDILRGIRRFLAVIAAGWFLFALYRAFATGTQADPEMHKIIFLWPSCVYGFGWLLTFMAYGFRPKAKGVLVFRSDGAAFVPKPRRFWR